MNPDGSREREESSEPPYVLPDRVRVRTHLSSPAWKSRDIFFWIPWRTGLQPRRKTVFGELIFGPKRKKYKKLLNIKGVGRYVANLYRRRMSLRLTLWQ